MNEGDTMRVVCALVMSVFPCHAFAQSNIDPTFNGLIQGVSCSAKSLIVCQNGFCQSAIPRSFNTIAQIHFDFRKQTFYEPSNNSRRSFVVKEVSKAEINKPLWIRASVDFQGADSNVTISAFPAGSQYNLDAVLTQKKGEIEIIVPMECDRSANFE